MQTKETNNFFEFIYFKNNELFAFAEVLNTADGDEK